MYSAHIWLMHIQDYICSLIELLLVHKLQFTSSCLQVSTKPVASALLFFFNTLYGLWIFDILSIVYNFFLEFLIFILILRFFTYLIFIFLFGPKLFPDSTILYFLCYILIVIQVVTRLLQFLRDLKSFTYLWFKEH